MPRRRKQDDDHAGAIDTQTSNVGERRKEIEDALDRIYRLKCEIRGIIADEVQGLRDDISDIKKSLRERFGLTNKMLQARLYSYEIEQDAAAASDQIMLDAIRELFEICPVSGQISMAAALDATTNGKAANGNGHAAPGLDEIDPEGDVAYQEGREAGEKGRNLNANPHVGKSKEQKRLKARWEAGYNDAQREMALALGKGAGDQPTAH